MGMIGVKRDMIKKKTEIEKNFDGLKKMVGEEAEKIADEYSGGMVTKTKEKIDSKKKSMVLIKGGLNW